MCVAAKAFHFEITKPGVDRIAECRRWLRRSLKAEHTLVPRSLTMSVKAEDLALGPIGALAAPIRDDQITAGAPLS